MRASVTEIGKGRGKETNVTEQPFQTPTTESTRLTEQDTQYMVGSRNLGALQVTPFQHRN